MKLRFLFRFAIILSFFFVCALIAISLTASQQRASLEADMERLQQAAIDAGNLHTLTYEYVLNGEQKTAYAWHTLHATLLTELRESAKAPSKLPDNAQQLTELFVKLSATSDSSSVRDRKIHAASLLEQLSMQLRYLSGEINTLLRDQATARASHERNLILLSSLASISFLLILAALFAYLSRHILQPLARLKDAITATSQTDSHTSFSHGSRNEIGDLARALDAVQTGLRMQLRREIEERSVIENDLQKAVDDRTANLNAIVNTAVDSIITTDTLGMILTANPATEKLFGYTVANLPGRNVSMLLPMPEQHAHVAYMKSYLETGETRIIGKGRELIARHRDGHLFPIHLSISEYRLDGDRYFTGIIRDISAQKDNERALTEAKAEAERANQAKSEFLSCISHELRTPLNAIIGFSQLLCMDQSLSTQARQSADQSLQGGRHLLALIDQILDLSRIEAGHMELSLETVEVAHTVDEIIGLLQIQAQKRDIRISNTCIKGLCVKADRSKLNQALINLVSNAIKFNADGGSIVIDLRPGKDETFLIAVSDTGCGIPPGRMHELFQPFNRLGIEKSNIEGTGIGLALTRRIVEMMSGKIFAENNPMGGCTFFIELAADNTTDPSLIRSKATSPVIHSVPEDKHLILYIEDNPSNLLLMTQVFAQRENFHLMSSHNPILGLELAHTRIPDLILLDINMYGMDGYQVLANIRTNPALKHIPVFAITANATARDIERGMAAGFNEYLTKPIDISRLLALLDEYLSEVH